MATIAISDLNPVGSAFFSDSENYLNELSDRELNETLGASPMTVTAAIYFGLLAAVIAFN